METFYILKVSTVSLNVLFCSGLGFLDYFFNKFRPLLLFAYGRDNDRRSSCQEVVRRNKILYPRGFFLAKIHLGSTARRPQLQLLRIVYDMRV